MSRQTPPPRSCPHCGAPTGRGYSARACDNCLAQTPSESLRDFRRRLQGQPDELELEQREAEVESRRPSEVWPEGIPF